MAFPTTSILDDFNRANEGPPPSSNWHAFRKPGGLKVLSNQVVASANPGDGYWTNSNIGPDCEVYITLASGSFNYFQLNLRVTNPGASFNGYTALFDWNSANNPGIYRVTSGTFTQLGANIVPASLGFGDSFGFEAIGSVLTMYRKPSGGSWAALDSRSDSTYPSSGYIALELSPFNTPADDFGGGSVTPSVIPDYHGFPKPPVVDGR